MNLGTAREPLVGLDFGGRVERVRGLVPGPRVCQQVAEAGQLVRGHARTSNPQPGSPPQAPSIVEALVGVDQVRCHPGQDDGVRHRLEERRVEVCVGARQAAEDALTVLGAEGAATAERVDEDVVQDSVADQEVPRHPDAVERDTDPAPEVDHEQGQRDRQPLLAVEDPIEQRVVRPVVVVVIAGETELGEQETPETVEGGFGALLGEVVEATELILDDETLVGVSRQQHRAACQVDLTGRAVHEFHEPEGRIGHGCTVPGRGAAARVVVRRGRG